MLRFNFLQSHLSLINEPQWELKLWILSLQFFNYKIFLFIILISHNFPLF